MMMIAAMKTRSVCGVSTLACVCRGLCCNQMANDFVHCPLYTPGRGLESSPEYTPRLVVCGKGLCGPVLDKWQKNK